MVDEEEREIAEDVPVDVKERLQEVEDLVLLIQIENAKLKEKLGVQEMLSSPAGGVEERLSKVESTIETIKTGAVPPNLEQRLAAAEQLAKQASEKAATGMAERLAKLESDIKDLRLQSGKMTPAEVAENIGKINAARMEMDNSISKFRSLKDAIEKSLAERQNLLGKVDQLEVDIEKAGAYFARMKNTEEKINAVASRIESVAEGVDAKMRAGAERIELLKRDIESRTASAEEKFKSRIEKIDATMENLDMKSRGLNEKIDQLQEIGKELEGVASIKPSLEEQTLRIASIEKSLSETNKHVSDIHTIKKELGEESTIRASLEKRIEDMMVKFDSVKDVNAHIEEEAIIRQGLESRLQDIASEVAGVRHMKGEIERIVQGGLARIEEKARSETNKHASDIHTIKKELGEESTIRASLEKRIEDMMVKFDSVKDVNAHIEEEAIIRQGLESRLQDIASEVAGIRYMKGEIEKAINRGLAVLDEKVKSANLDEKLSEIRYATENKINEVSAKIDGSMTEVENRLKHENSSVGEQLTELRARMENGLNQENAIVDDQLAAFDKKLADVQQSVEILRDPMIKARDEMEKIAETKIDEFSSDLEEMKKDLHLEEIRGIRGEIAEHRRVIQNLKADLEIAAARFFTTNLEEFARTIDRKFPGFVTRDEYQKHLNELSGRLRTIEAPDLSPLAVRVEMAERKLNDVHDMMQSLARTMPIVLE